jgi:hypothetical protein
MRGFKSFTNAVVTITGIELAHRIHKHQFSFETRPALRRRLAANNLGPSADTMIDAYIKLMRVLAFSALDAPEPLPPGAQSSCLTR